MILSGMPRGLAHTQSGTADVPGVNSVLVTHNLHHGYQVCDRHIVMNHGKKILDIKREDTTVEELTAAVVEGAEGVRRYRERRPLAQV